MRTFLSIAVLALVVVSFAYLGKENTETPPKSGQYDRYFETPSAAVALVTKLLREEDWKTLSTYYDLTKSPLDRSSLEDANFFLESEKPEVVHPAGFWRYKQPFAPGFEFESSRIIGNDIIEVTVVVEIDQGDGTVQRGLDTFRLKAHPEGYQLLPEDG